MELVSLIAVCFPLYSLFNFRSRVEYFLLFKVKFTLVLHLYSQEQRNFPMETGFRRNNVPFKTRFD
jgi:hypothetical protein